jgi:hypothetical protein
MSRNQPETIYLEKDVFCPDPDNDYGTLYRAGWYYRDPNQREFVNVFGPFSSEQEAKEAYYEF